MVNPTDVNLQGATTGMRLRNLGGKAHQGRASIGKGGVWNGLLKSHVRGGGDLSLISIKERNGRVIQRWSGGAKSIVGELQWGVHSHGLFGRRGEVKKVVVNDENAPPPQ